MSDDSTRVLLVASGALPAAYLPVWATVLSWARGYDVRIVLSHGATSFVRAMPLSAITRHAVHGPGWSSDQRRGAEHVELGAWPHVTVVWPASLSFCAKLAASFTEQLAVAVVAAATGPVVLCPSIPAPAVKRPGTRRVMEQLHEDGYHLLGPVEGPGAATRSQEAGSAVPFELVLPWIVEQRTKKNVTADPPSVRPQTVAAADTSKEKP